MNGQNPLLHAAVPLLVLAGRLDSGKSSDTSRVRLVVEIELYRQNCPDRLSGMLLLICNSR